MKWAMHSWHLPSLRCALKCLLALLCIPAHGRDREWRVHGDNRVHAVIKVA